MAKLMLIGEVAQVELTSDPEEGQTIATCVDHFYYPGPSGHDSTSCGWTERYDTLDDAGEYAADHADTGRR
jgi:hypothetical protein